MRLYQNINFNISMFSDCQNNLIIKYIHLINFRKLRTNDKINRTNLSYATVYAQIFITTYKFEVNYTHTLRCMKVEMNRPSAVVVLRETITWRVRLISRQ